MITSPRFSLRSDGMSGMGGTAVTEMRVFSLEEEAATPAGLPLSVDASKTLPQRKTRFQRLKELLTPPDGSIWVRIGWFFVVLAAFADALTNVWNFTALALIPGGVVMILAEAFLFVGTCSLQFYIGHKIVPDLFERIREGNLFEGLSQTRRYIFWFGLIVSVAVGISMAALAFQYSCQVFISFGFSTPVLNLIFAGIFAVATAIFFSALSIDSMRELLIQENLKESIILYFKSVYNFAALDSKGNPKKKWVVILEGTLTLLISGAVCVLVVLGLIATNKLAHTDLSSLMHRITHFSRRMIETISYIVSMLLSTLAQGPFAIRTTCLFIQKVANFFTFGGVETLLKKLKNLTFEQALGRVFTLEFWLFVGEYVLKLLFVFASSLIPYAAMPKDPTVGALGAAGAGAGAVCELELGSMDVPVSASPAPSPSSASEGTPSSPTGYEPLGTVGESDHNPGSQKDRCVLL